MRKSRLAVVYTSPVLVLWMAVAPPAASACSRVKPFSFDELFVAEVIVRATAVRYVADPSTQTADASDRAIEFNVEEVLRGRNVSAKIILSGRLTDEDDYNEVQVPYDFVRPGGRGGSCFARNYKEGAQFSYS